MSSFILLLSLLVSINAVLCQKATSNGKGISENQVHDSSDQYLRHQNVGPQKRHTVMRRGIIRPCPTMELACIRDYFSRSAKCTRAVGTVPAIIHRAQSNLFFPIQNLTMTQVGVTYRFVNGAVLDFYINTENDVTLLAIQFSDIQINSSNTYFRYHRSRKEPIVTKAPTSGHTGKVTTTTIFLGADHQDLRKSETTWFIDGPVVAMMGPQAGYNPDPEVIKSHAAFKISRDMVMQEVTLPVWVASSFIQDTICHFGLKLL